MGTLCQKILAVFEFAAELGAKGPVLPLRSEYALIGVGCCLLLAATVFLLRGRDHARTAAGLLSVTVLCGGYFFDALSRQNSLTVTQYTFSKGSSIVLQQGSRAVLVGAGGKSFDGRQLVSELLANGVQTVDALIIPADKAAYTGGSYDMLTALGAAVVIAPENSRLTQGLDFGKTEQNYPLSDSLWELFGSGTLDIHTGGDSAAITVTWSNSRILLDSSDDQVPWPADVRLNYDKSAEESDTTRENYVIMISSGSRLRPAARLELPTSNETKGAV